jgi:hypothetical protein
MRRYFDKSSFTLASATSRFSDSLFGEPGFRFGFRDDGEDLDRLACDVIEHPDVIHSEPVLRAAQPPEALNATLTDFGRFVTKMGFQRVSHPRSRISFELFERLNRAWRKHDLVAHSGYNIARTLLADNWMRTVGAPC